MISEKFRHQLRQEAESWQEEGLIDGKLYAQLSQRYGFAELDTSSRNRFVAIFLILGSLLLGLAAITLVAANWQAWSRTVKAGLLLALFVGVNAGGFYLWRGSAESWQSRLGKGLLLLGALILGANLALMSQMFHRSGPVYHLLLAWAMGVLAMAFSLRLTLLGILAAILMALGYGGGIVVHLSSADISGWSLAIAHFPLLASLLLLPLAYCCRSRWIFGMGAVLTIISLEINLPAFLPEIYRSPIAGGIVVAIAAILPTAMLWAYPNLGAAAGFRPLARCLALFCFSLLLFLLSFNFWGESPNFGEPDFSTISGQDWLVLLDFGLLGNWAIWSWWRLGFAEDESPWRLDANSSGIGAILLLSGVLLWWQWTVGALGAIATVIFNLLLFLLAVGLLREALAQGKRLGFWGGVLLLGIQLAARMLEYETGLLLKAIVLFCCGVAVIAAGLWFERYLRRLVP
jgi:uncharacterized membrane protein